MNYHKCFFNAKRQNILNFKNGTGDERIGRKDEKKMGRNIFKEMERRSRQRMLSGYMMRYDGDEGAGGSGNGEGANGGGEGNPTEVEGKKQTFDDILSNKEYQAEFDRRVSKAIETAKSKWQGEQNSTLDEKINSAIKTAKEEYEKDLNETKFNSALNMELLRSKAVDIDMVKVKLKLDDIKLNEDGSLSGLSDQLKEIKEKYGFLFEDHKQKYNPTGGGTPDTVTTLRDAIAENYKKK